MGYAGRIELPQQRVEGAGQRGWLGRQPHGENVAAALEAPSLEDVTDPVGRTFRAKWVVDF